MSIIRDGLGILQAFPLFFIATLLVVKIYNPGLGLSALLSQAHAQQSPSPNQQISRSIPTLRSSGCVPK